MIYPGMIIIDLIVFNTVPFDRVSFDPYPLVALSAVSKRFGVFAGFLIPYRDQGIAPTLIMVRAKLGQNVESLQEAVSDIRFTNQTAQRGFRGTTTLQHEAEDLSTARSSGVF